MAQLPHYTYFKGGHMESKIKIKLGPIEVEYEGSEAFLKKELPELIKTVTDLYKSTDIKIDKLAEEVQGKKSHGGKLQLSTASIASKLSASSGSDLILAAAAHLTFSKQIEVFTRKQLLAEMKSASGYFKTSYSNNLSENIKTLLKDKLNEPSSGHYSLTANARKNVESRLANN
jgi:hypothetical protein